MPEDQSITKSAGHDKPLVNRANSPKKQAMGIAFIAFAMVLLFVPPPSTYFVYGVFLATPVMMLVTFWITGYVNLFRPSPKSVAAGLVSAVLLYVVFLAGNYGIRSFGTVVGIRASSEESIYSTIGSHPLYLQVIILIFDAFGFESYFRGTLQNFFSNNILKSNRKVGGALLTALCDSLIHIVSLNPLWVVTTFLADSVWGITYYSTKDLSSSVTSHLVWDTVIFILAPIR